VGYWHAVAADPRRPAGYWKAARACVLVGQLREGKEARADTFVRGLRTTQLLLEQDDSVAEGHYYYALNLGLLAKERTSRGHEAVKEMLPHLEKAAELDPDLDEAGAFRTLALVYLRAPGWPTSVGDEEAGLDYARLAVEQSSGHPGNHLALAEALLANGERDEARAALARARQLAADTSWTRFDGEEFQQQAASLEKKL
jgi:tetratricopeptide (TPR) repeat protein